jgi:manganese/zinc/iron transport system substrate-binding protein
MSLLARLHTFFITLMCLATLAPAAAHDQPTKIVGTIGMVSDLVAKIAGDHADVTTLVKAGLDPHLYKPTRNDVNALRKADVVFYSGLMLEGKMSDVLIRAATSGRKVYPVTSLLGEEYLLEPEEFEGHVDPHVWGDPKAWLAAVDVIAEKLAANDRRHADDYQKNAEKLKKEISAVDAYAEKVLNTVPEESRVLVTAHDAFNYFARRFGYEVLAIQGISTESEAGVKDIENLVDVLVSKKIGAVFVESTISDKNIQALIQGAAAKGHTVVIGGELFSDAMGAEGTYEGTYVGMVDHNATTIACALGGEAPEKGLNGKLSH